MARLAHGGFTEDRAATVPAGPKVSGDFLKRGHTVVAAFDNAGISDIFIVDGAIVISARPFSSAPLSAGSVVVVGRHDGCLRAGQRGWSGWNQANL